MGPWGTGKMPEIKGVWAMRASLFCLLPHLLVATLAGLEHTKKYGEDPLPAS